MTTSIETPVHASGTFTIGSDLTVHRLGYGAMQLTGDGVWGPPDDPDECRRVLRRAVDLGVDFIDTADSYGPFVSEDLIREALHPYPDDLVIATKGGLTRTGPAQWPPVGRAPYLRQCVEMSLRRLGVERIDLYQLHRVDPKTPMEESLGELRTMQDEGKIRHIGVSEVDVDTLKKAREIVDVVTVQNLYNVVDRQHEAVLDYCEAEGIGFIPWFPLKTGKLAEQRQPAGRGREAPRRQRAAARPRLAAAPLPGHAADPRYVVGRAPGGELRGRDDRADRRGVRRDRQLERDGDADTAAGVGAVTLLLAREVQRADPLAGLARGVVEPVGRHDPGDLELQAVGVVGVEALGGAVVTRAAERTGVGERRGQPLELGEGVDLPREVVEPDGGPSLPPTRQHRRRSRTVRGRGRSSTRPPAGTPRR